MRSTRALTAILLGSTVAASAPLGIADVPAERRGTPSSCSIRPMSRSRSAARSSERTELFNPGFQIAAAQAAAAEDRLGLRTGVLYDDLGTLTDPVTTRAPEAQRYFDQGLRLAYAFNHGEAARAFRQAQAIDPTCAMCYWGEAFALGPNINYPMQPEAVAPAFAAIAQAMALKDGASERERALIEALRARYSADPGADRKALDAAYADAMTGVAARVPGRRPGAGAVRRRADEPAALGLLGSPTRRRRRAAPRAGRGAGAGAAAQSRPSGRHPPLHPHGRGLDDAGARGALRRPAERPDAGCRAPRAHAGPHLLPGRPLPGLAARSTWRRSPPTRRCSRRPSSSRSTATSTTRTTCTSCWSRRRMAGDGANAVSAAEKLARLIPNEVAREIAVGPGDPAGALLRPRAVQPAGDRAGAARSGRRLPVRAGQLALCPRDGADPGGRPRGPRPRSAASWASSTEGADFSDARRVVRAGEGGADHRGQGGRRPDGAGGRRPCAGRGGLARGGGDPGRPALHGAALLVLSGAPDPGRRAARGGQAGRGGRRSSRRACTRRPTTPSPSTA